MNKKAFGFLAVIVARGLPFAMNAWGQPGSPALSYGIKLEKLVEASLPGYRVVEKRLSEVGLGYHYGCQRSKDSIVLTGGIFGTAAEASAAAELSHKLMPEKPRPGSAIGDQSWVWEDGRGSAVRFRSGRCLLRIAGTLPIADTRELAKRMAAQISADPALKQDVGTNGAPFVRVDGLRPTIKAGRDEVVEISVDHSSPTNPFVAGVWMSHGTSSPGTRANVFRLRASGAPQMITVRCFAVFADNFVAVQTRQVQVTDAR